MNRSTEKAIATLSLVLMLSKLARAAPPKRRPGAGSSPGAPGSARERWDPLSIKKRTAAAIASGDPAAMRSLAKAIRAEGYTEEAAQLEAAAAAAERSRS